MGGSGHGGMGGEAAAGARRVWEMGADAMSVDGGGGAMRWDSAWLADGATGALGLDPEGRVRLRISGPCRAVIDDGGDWPFLDGDGWSFGAEREGNVARRVTYVRTRCLAVPLPGVDGAVASVPIDGGLVALLAQGLAPGTPGGMWGRLPAPAGWAASVPARVTFPVLDAARICIPGSGERFRVGAWPDGMDDLAGLVDGLPDIDVTASFCLFVAHAGDGGAPAGGPLLVACVRDLSLWQVGVEGRVDHGLPWVGGLRGGRTATGRLG